MRAAAISCGLSVWLVLASWAHAAPLSNLYVFGDSFSDTGNVFAATNGILPPDPPYYQGRFSDGPVWVERLADRLGLPLVANGADPTAVRGNNFAAGGARTAADISVPPLGTIPSIVSQVQYFTAAVEVLPEDALYVVSGGYNDLLLAADPEQELGLDARRDIAMSAAAAIDLSLRQLVTHGARHVLVANLADLGLTPGARDDAAIASEMTALFNTTLAAELDSLQQDFPLRLYRLDVFRLANQVVADARENGGGVYGITNVEVPIFKGFAGSPGADPATSLFADMMHISAVAHRHLGDAAAVLVPEPATLRIGLIALLLLSTRRFGDHR